MKLKNNLSLNVFPLSHFIEYSICNKSKITLNQQHVVYLKFDLSGMFHQHIQNSIKNNEISIIWVPNQ